MKLQQLQEVSARETQQINSGWDDGKILKAFFNQDNLSKKDKRELKMLRSANKMDIRYVFTSKSEFSITKSDMNISHVFSIVDPNHKDQIWMFWDNTSMEGILTDSTIGKDLNVSQNVYKG